jgi:hypothetical protein
VKSTLTAVLAKRITMRSNASASGKMAIIAAGIVAVVLAAIQNVVGVVVNELRISGSPILAGKALGQRSASAGEIQNGLWSSTVRKTLPDIVDLYPIPLYSHQAILRV